MDFPNDPLQVAKVLEQRKKELRRSSREIARRAGLSSTIINNWLRGDADPRNARTQNLMHLAEALDWTYDELQQAIGIKPTPHPDEIAVRVHRIPVVDAGAGLPRWNDEDEHISLDFPEFKGKSARQLFAVRVCGDSMKGYASDGHIVVFDTVGEIVASKVVAVHYPDDGLVVKRFLGISENKRLLLGNDNQEATPAVFEAPEGSVIKGVAYGVWKFE